MRIKLLLLSACAATIAMVGMVCLTGCETGGDTISLTIEPNYVDLSEDGSAETQTFTVTGGIRELSLPLEWSVSDANLGNIGSQGGYSAAYIRVSGRHGDNSIRVRDQYGATGVATVHQ